MPKLIDLLEEKSNDYSALESEFIELTRKELVGKKLGRGLERYIQRTTT